MKRLLLLVIVFLAVGQIRTPLSRADVLEPRPMPLSGAVCAADPQGAPSSVLRLPSESYWSRLWTAVVARIKTWAAAFVAWLTGTVKEGALLIWDRVRFELVRIGKWLAQVWRWMDIGGGVGQLP